MKKFWTICIALAFILLPIGVLLTGCGDSKKEELSYAITITNSEDYTISCEQTTAKAGEKIELNVTVLNQDKYILDVYYNENRCSEDDGKYSFIMPTQDVTLSAKLGKYENVFTDGNGFASLISEPVIALKASNPYLLIDFNANWMTILNYEITSTNTNVLPNEAISLVEIKNHDIVGASGSNEIEQAKIYFDTSLLKEGSSWLVMEFENGNSSSNSATLIVKVQVQQYIEVETVKANITFDISSITDKSQNYTLRVWDDDFIDGSNLWNGKSYNDYLINADIKNDTITFTIDYLIGHQYSIRLSRGAQDDYYTNLFINARNEGGSSEYGYTQYTGDSEIQTSDGILIGGGELTFITSNLNIELSVSEI